MKAPCILVVDDEPDIRDLVREILEDEGYQVEVAENAEAARRARRRRRPDLVLLDIWMPDSDGISLLREWSDQGPLDAPVVMISGHGTVETAIEATRLGAYDFLEKPLSLAKLLLTVRHALEADRLRRENLGLRHSAAPLLEPLGQSEVMAALRGQVQRVAQHNAWVLLSGEPGSGLELFGRYLHACSARAEGPFISIRAATLSDETAARELFGSERDGQIHYGLFEQAGGGTLFISEVADMDLAVQAKLLSVLENRALVRIGGNEEVALDVRLVAASHRDLAAEVAAGRFRGDLYYRLNVLPLSVPPLRAHGEDVPELLTYYVDYFANHDGLPYRRITTAALNRLRQYHWPGNVRELKNLVQRLLILGQGEEITLEDVEAALGHAQADHGEQVPAEFLLPLREARTRFEKAYFEYQLNHGEGGVGQIARRVGIERTHLYRKLRSLGIKSNRADEEDTQT